MINIHNNAHKHGIKGPCKCSHWSGIPNPPCSENIPDQETRIGIKKDTEPAEVFPVPENIIFNDQHWNKSRKKKGRISILRPCNRKQQSG
jgi:hypothetical protein